MNATFKGLDIFHNDGRGVITLENLSEIEVELYISRGEAWHLLEIFDLDAE